MRAINDYMVSLTDLENELLERLSNAPDDILSDVALIEGLEKTKQASTEIEQKVELAKKQEISINAARNEFRQVAAESRPGCTSSSSSCAPSTTCTSTRWTHSPASSSRP